MSDTLQEREDQMVIEDCKVCGYLPHMPWCDDYVEPVKEVNSYPPSLIEAAKRVEQWWLENGKDAFSGTPAAIFDLRAAIEDYGKHQPAAGGGGEGCLHSDKTWYVHQNGTDVACNHDYIAIATTRKHAAQIVREHNQHQSLVAELDTLKGEALGLVAERDVGLRAIAYLICDGIVNSDKHYPPEMATWARDLMVGEQRVGIQLIREAIATALNEQRSTSE